MPASGSATKGPGFTYTGQVSAFSTQASSTARTATRSPLTSRPKQDVYVTLSGSLIYRTSMGTSDGEHSLAEGEVHRAERASSRRSRTASFSFGGGQRLGKEPASAAAELGPMYDVKPTGRQSPQYSFGKQQREPEALREARRKAVPGPGQYKSASGFGGQWVSTRPTSSFATLGRSSRDVGSKLYASKADMRGGADPNTAARGAGTPGPGQYAPNVSPVSSKRTSPQFSFGGRGITRGERSVIVGEAAPGSYHSAGSLGRQSSSRNRSAPRTTFGRASRDNAGRVSQPGVRPAAVKSTPVRLALCPAPPTLVPRVLILRAAPGSWELRRRGRRCAGRPKCLHSPLVHWQPLRALPAFGHRRRRDARADARSGKLWHPVQRRPPGQLPSPFLTRFQVWHKPACVAG